MKKLIFLIIISISTIVKTQAQDYFVGLWENKSKTQIIEIYKNDESYYGKIFNPKDLKNNVVLVQMKKRNRKVLYGGTYFDNKLNKHFEARIRLTDTSTIKLIKINGFLNKTEIWYRIVIKT